MTLEELNSRCAYNTQNGVWIVAKEPGRCTVEIRVTDASRNPFGYAHGGLIFTGCDVTACVAAMEESSEQLVTQSSNLSFVRPGLGDVLRVEAQCQYKGQRTAMSRVEVYSEAGKLVAGGEFLIARRHEQ